MKKVTVISSSMRGRSNSELLAKRFADGASAAGHSVTEISLKARNIKFCIGCLKCQEKGDCVLNDDMGEINEISQNSDVLVFASPVYFYSVAGQMKTFLDRTNPLYVKQYRFREVFFLSSAAEDDEKANEGALKAISGWIECFEGVQLKGVLFAKGVTDPGSVIEEMLEDAYRMGAGI